MGREGGWVGVSGDMREKRRVSGSRGFEPLQVT